MKPPAIPIIAEQDHVHDLTTIFEHEELCGLPKTGIVHIGADVGQEVAQYLSYGFQHVMLIEANPECCKVLHSKFGDDPRVKIFNYAVCDSLGMINFYIHTSRSGSTEPASILPMGRFKQIVRTLHTPKTIRVPATTLDALFEKYQIAGADYNFINIDIQGAELLAFKGATKLLSSIDVIVSEVNLIEMYENGALEGDIVAFLGQHGFERKHAIYHTLYDDDATFPAWGECLFVKL